MPEDRSEIRAALDAARAGRVAALRMRLAARFEAVAAGCPAVLELGCGHGHFLTAYAAAHPEEYCVGVDLIAHRIERAERKCRRAALGNLDFINTDASEFLAAIPDGLRFAAFFLLFSDPWPKTRHRKNRLIQTALLDRFAALAVPGATRLYFRTDHVSYFNWAEALVKNHPVWKVVPDAPWRFECETIFSERAPGYQSFVAECTADGKGS
ncbi:MAG: methyltransferase domain-containing protein [Puniceicoccales bacterium]|jgi:tRNA (guanine-N7-)-methyltransferase|nr:methyltransferase domain-containing protein [Puniceicoccales bacterium]